MSADGYESSGYHDHPPVIVDDIRSARIAAAIWGHKPDRLHAVTSEALLVLVQHLDPMPADLPARISAAITGDDELGAWAREAAS